MSGAYVFDAEAIIASLYDEPGHDQVGDLLGEVETDDAEGLLPETNASEVYYLVARYGGTPEEKPDENISLADAYAVALAHDRDATFIAGGDDDFDTLPVDIDVERSRDHGV